MIINIIYLILAICLHTFIFYSSDTTKINFLSNTVGGNIFNCLIEEGYQNIREEEYNDLLYRTYAGTYVDLLQEASLIISSARIDMEEGNIVRLINATNNRSISQTFVEGMSIDNVAGGRYYVYICQEKNGEVVDAAPEVKIFYPSSKKLEN